MKVAIDGINRLHLVLQEIADREQISQALGISDEDANNESEDFWIAQARTAKARFLTLCQHQIGTDQSIGLMDLDDESAHDLADQADVNMETQGFDYSEVRQWFYVEENLSRKKPHY
jgi:hypothetical protein